MVAWTWNHFLHHPDQPEWLARLPMTKAVVRAMDTLAAYRQNEQEITKFGVAGASKRGWTTWTVAAVDSRVIAMILVVMDLLDFQSNIKHQFQAYGGWSFALHDYFDLNFTRVIDSDNVKKMAAIVDPFTYMSRFTMPKLVVNAGGDEFFLPDDDHWWWTQMPEPKNRLLVENAEHSLATGLQEVLPACVSFVNAVLQEMEVPEMQWTIDPTSGDITVTLDSSQPKPTNVTLMWANSNPGTGLRDFRLVGGYPDPTIQDCFWTGKKLEESSPNTWIAHMDPPSDGWIEFMVHMKFPGPLCFSGEQYDFEFSTQISVVPNTFPFPPCTGDACYGHLM